MAYLEQKRTSAHFYFSHFTGGPQLIIFKTVTHVVVVVRRDAGVSTDKCTVRVKRRNVPVFVAYCLLSGT